MNSIKRSLAGILTLVLLLVPALTVCLAEDGPITPFEQKIVVNLMREVDPGIWFPEGEDFQDNVLTDFYEEKLNIEYVVKWLVERGRFGEQLDLAIASDDLPDMFEVNQYQLNRLARAGQIQPLDEVYEQYASENLRAVLGYNDNMFFKPATYDGRVYGLPVTDDFANCVPLLWIRQDWLDALELQAPKTFDEMVAVAKAFMAADFDGNGIDDTVGLALDNSLWANFKGLVCIFGHVTDMWVPDGNGNLVYSDTMPEMKEALAKLQTLYLDGIIDPEFAVKDWTKMTELVVAERCGMAIEPFYYPLNDPVKSKAANPKAEWNSFPIPKDYEGDYRVSANSPCGRYLVVRQGFKYPEAAIKGNNLWYELWRGEYAEYYHGLNLGAYAGAGESFKGYPPFWFDPPLKNREQAFMLFPAWDTRDVAKITHPETMKQWNKMTNYYDNGDEADLVGWYHLPLFQAFTTIEENYGAPENLVYDAYQGPATQTIASLRPLVDKVRYEGLIKFMMGESLDNFDAFVADWNNVGGTEYAAEVNAWYHANK